MTPALLALALVLYLMGGWATYLLVRSRIGPAPETCFVVVAICIWPFILLDLPPEKKK